MLAFSCFLNVPSNHTMMSLYSIYVCFLLNNSKSSGIVRYFFDDDGFFYVVGIFGDYVFFWTKRVSENGGVPSGLIRIHQWMRSGQSWSHPNIICLVVWNMAFIFSIYWE